MTNSLYFVNPGEIDMDAALTMGVNAKIAENNPIGYFGTGLKYAIAVLLRTGHQITIAAGEVLYNFTTDKRSTRGVDYNIILCNGEKTGFTTDLGKNWQVWKAYRELYCNSKDENGFVITTPITPKPDFTIITITGSDICTVHSEKEKYFISTKPLFSTEECEIHKPDPGLGGSIFYRGVRVEEPNKNRAYNYNLLRKTQLTEDRSLASHYEAYSAIACAIAKSTMPKIIFDTALNKQSEEHSRCLWSFVTDVSAPFASALESCRESLPYDLSSLRRTKCITAPTYSIKKKLTESEKEILKEAKEILDKIGLYISNEVLISSDLGEGVLGKVFEGKIYLSEVLLTQGPTRVASTILEEEIHLTKGLVDCTYEMQTYLFDLLITNSLNLIKKY